MLKITAALVAGASIFALVPNLEAAQVYRLSTPTVNIIVIDGDIDHATTTKVRYALTKFDNVAGFVINSRGGSMLAARELQKLVVGTGSSSKVTVPAGAVCASACVDVLFAAATPQAHVTSRVGVHLGTSMATGAPTVDQFATRLYRARGVPESVITKMNSTPPASVSWLTSSEFRSIPGALIYSDDPTPMASFIAQAQYEVGFKQ